MALTTTVLRRVVWDTQQTALHREIAACAKSLMVRPVPIHRLYEPCYPYAQGQFPVMCAPDFYGVDRVVGPPRHRR